MGQEKAARAEMPGEVGKLQVLPGYLEGVLGAAWRRGKQLPSGTGIKYHSTLRELLWHLG